MLLLRDCNDGRKQYKGKQEHKDKISAFDVVDKRRDGKEESERN
jgi:hypothetical protein